MRPVRNTIFVKLRVLWVFVFAALHFYNISVCSSFNNQTAVHLYRERMAR